MTCLLLKNNETLRRRPPNIVAEQSQVAPAFAKAAAQLSPQIILAKPNTEAAPQTSAQFATSAILTMILFKNGNEVSRQSGVMNTEQIAQFARDE